MTKNIVVLGSTGSVGVQSLDVIARLGLRVCALAAGGNNISLLEKQAREHAPALVAVACEDAARELRVRLADTGVRVLGGNEALCEAARAPGADLVISAIVGMAGLAPTLAAIDAGCCVALANKEALVAAGGIVMARAREKNVQILPVDSEHSAIFQCLSGSREPKDVKKLWITASGGPFYGMSRAETEGMSPAQALAHPNWSMGARLTVDSATMANKGFEFIEAMWLYGLPADRIGILVHRESIVHSLVEFADGALLAQLSMPDMRLPIQYALTWPARMPSPIAPLDLAEIGRLSFAAPDLDAFPALGCALRAARMGGCAGAVLAGADEEAVGLFLKEKITFGAISRLVEYALDTVPAARADSLDAVMGADLAAREAVRYAAGVL